MNVNLEFFVYHKLYKLMLAFILLKHSILINLKYGHKNTDWK